MIACQVGLLSLLHCILMSCAPGIETSLETYSRVLNLKMTKLDALKENGAKANQIAKAETDVNNHRATTIKHIVYNPEQQRQVNSEKARKATLDRFAATKKTTPTRLVVRVCVQHPSL